MLLLLIFLTSCGFERKGKEEADAGVKDNVSVEQNQEDTVKFTLDESEMRVLIYNNSDELVNLITSDTEFEIKKSAGWENLQKSKPAFTMEQGIQAQSTGEYDFSYISDYLNVSDDQKKIVKVIFYYKFETKENEVFQKEFMFEYN